MPDHSFEDRSVGNLLLLSWLAFWNATNSVCLSERSIEDAVGGERRERRRGEGIRKRVSSKLFDYFVYARMFACTTWTRRNYSWWKMCGTSVEWMQNNGLEGGEKKDENVQLTDIGAFYRAWKIVREANLINLYESLYHCYRVSRTGIPLFGSFFFFLAREKKRRRKLGPI